MRAEWTKFRTVRGWVIGPAVAALATVLVGLLGTAAPDGAADAGFPRGPGGQAVNDAFYFVHRTLDGDGAITVPVGPLTGRTEPGPGAQAVPGVQPWAKAGVIVKAGPERGSGYAAVMLTGGHGIRMQDDYTHDTPGPALTGDTHRLRLVRAGDDITGYASGDGVHWTTLGAAHLPGLPRTLRAGLFVASPQAATDTGAGTGYAPAVATAEFGPAELVGRWQDTGWQGEQAGGDAGTSGSYSDTLRGGFTESAGRITVTGAGDIAPVVGGPPMGPAHTVENFLVGSFAGLLVLVALGAGSVTVEYRRGLIRTTLAAHPGRGRVLAAKAAVLGATAAAAGLAGAALAVPLGRLRSEAAHFRALPVPAATELRAVAGTALLFALVTLLALAAGVVLRRGATAVTAVVAAVVLPYLFATSGVLPAGPAQWLLRLTPAAGFAIQQTVPRYPQVDGAYTPEFGYFPLPPWAGLAVLAGYTLAAGALALVLLRRRDV
ncbi:hypothetical protein GCM10010495_49210 [Kitasatospora herbaricolor]|uniref:ABC transporter permease subunit n=1 Tax=Kitasatospora herbaricolor TaxID=68217 RepID=UPI0019A66C37|nr:ABC transporter permease subunit [Kitasatospora herbaricolor]MDQ0305713.1 ABC-type transport system involved in multi-copper enzyme maturation permease subunit [Kitasatospora herbaricolor]GGV27265.1 hypothetical protein GCM10010495_49210 [Kitasatospora herbaricolor]